MSTELYVVVDWCERR